MRAFNTVCLFVASLLCLTCQRNAALGQDGHIIASSSTSGSVVIRDPATGRVISQNPYQPPAKESFFKDQKLTNTAYCDDSGGSQAIGNNDGGLAIYTATKIVHCTSPPDHCIWDSETALQGGIIAHPGRILAIAFSPNGQILVSAGGDGSIRLWNPFSGKLLKVVISPAGVQTFVLSKDGRTLFAAFRNEIVDFAFPSMRPVKAFRGHDDVVTELALSPDGKSLWSKSDDQTIKLWDTRRAVDVATYGDIRDAAVDPDGDTLAYSLGDGNVNVASLTGHGPPVTLRGLVRQTDVGTDLYDIRTLAFGPRGRFLAGGDYVLQRLSMDTTDASYQHVLLWDTHTAKLLHDWRHDYANVLTFDKRGSELTELSPPALPAGRVVRVRSIETGRVVKEFCQYSKSDGEFLFNEATHDAAVIREPDGVTLLAYSRVVMFDENVGLAIWNLKSRHLMKILDSSSLLDEIAVGPAPYLVAIGEHGSVWLWNYETRKLLWKSNVTLPDGSPIAAVSKCGLVAIADGYVQYHRRRWFDPTPITLYDPATGHILRQLTGMNEGVSMLTFTRDGKRLFAASGEGVVREWEMDVVPYSSR